MTEQQTQERDDETPPPGQAPVDDPSTGEDEPSEESPEKGDRGAAGR